MAEKRCDNLPGFIHKLIRVCRAPVHPPDRKGAWAAIAAAFTRAPLALAIPIAFSMRSANSRWVTVVS